MEYPNNFSSTKEYANDQLISGSVLLGALVVVNIVLLLNWLGFISLA